MNIFFSLRVACLDCESTGGELEWSRLTSARSRRPRSRPHTNTLPLAKLHVEAAGFSPSFKICSPLHPTASAAVVSRRVVCSGVFFPPSSTSLYVEKDSPLPLFFRFFKIRFISLLLLGGPLKKSPALGIKFKSFAIGQSELRAPADPSPPRTRQLTPSFTKPTSTESARFGEARRCTQRKPSSLSSHHSPRTASEGATTRRRRA